MKVKSGEITAVIGASRGGKSQYVFKEIASEKRLLVWDVADEYPTTIKARTQRELINALKNTLGKPGRISFVGRGKSDFDFFCRVAQTWVLAQYQSANSCSLVFEETADVTNPTKAPENYGIILRRFLRYGVNIYAITQRPAESDKTAIGNASIIHCTRLKRENDRKSVANDSSIPLDELTALVSDREAGRFEYIHALPDLGTWKKGALTFVNNRAKFTLETKKQTKKPL
jgi:hypothetical protein